MRSKVTCNGVTACAACEITMSLILQGLYRTLIGWPWSQPILIYHFFSLLTIYPSPINWFWCLSSYHAVIACLDIFFHLNSYLSVVFDHSLFVFLSIEVFAPGLGWTVLEEDAAVLAVKFLTHNYNRLWWAYIYPFDPPLDIILNFFKEMNRTRGSQGWTASLRNEMFLKWNGEMEKAVRAEPVWDMSGVLTIWNKDNDAYACISSNL